jgi:Mg2+-importing ATPase
MLMAVAAPEVREGAAIPAPVTAPEAAALRADDVLARLGSDANGLAAGEAERRLQAVGPNAVRSYRARALPVLWSQLRSPLLLLLAVTAIASAFLGQASDAVIIGVILLASVGLGSSTSTRRPRPPRRSIRASGTGAWCCGTDTQRQWT